MKEWLPRAQCSASQRARPRPAERPIAAPASSLHVTCCHLSPARPRSHVVTEFGNPVGWQQCPVVPGPRHRALPAGRSFLRVPGLREASVSGRGQGPGCQAPCSRASPAETECTGASGISAALGVSYSAGRGSQVSTNTPSPPSARGAPHTLASVSILFLLPVATPSRSTRALPGATRAGGTAAPFSVCTAPPCASLSAPPFLGLPTPESLGWSEARRGGGGRQGHLRRLGRGQAPLQSVRGSPVTEAFLLVLCKGVTPPPRRRIRCQP